MKTETSKIPAKAEVKDPRREYTVKLPIINAGVEKVAGDKVVLTEHEAASLLESGHIA